MPLRAFVDNEEKISTSFSDKEWIKLKLDKKEIILPCCNSQGFTRTSPRGMKHFVHNLYKNKDTKKCINWKPESEKHSIIKQRIYNIIKNTSWEVTLEARGDDWIADILAVKGKGKIAFEIQLSSQSLEKTIERQKRYEESGIRCCWLFEDTASNFKKFKPRKILPVFFLTIDSSWNNTKNFQELINIPIFLNPKYINCHDDKDIKLRPTYSRFELEVFILDLLNGYYKFREGINIKENKEIIYKEHTHWCYSKENKFCYSEKQLEAQKCHTFLAEEYGLNILFACSFYSPFKKSIFRILRNEYWFR